MLRDGRWGHTVPALFRVTPNRIANADNHDVVPRRREVVNPVRRPTVLLVPTFVLAFSSLAPSLFVVAGWRLAQQ